MALAPSVWYGRQFGGYTSKSFLKIFNQKIIFNYLSIFLIHLRSLAVLEFVNLTTLVILSLPP